jgi:hypothetical protein
MTLILSLFCGAVLGTRYKVLCLPPVIMLAAIAIAVFDHIYGVSFKSTALTVLAVGVELQIGYLVGALLCITIGASSAGATRPVQKVHFLGSPAPP